jgi:glycosyltransferase involved in cell wall biosynthesis
LTLGFCQLKVTVITAVFNNKDTISDALDSLLAQTHPDIEMIVIDGASTDGTLEVFRSYQDRLSVLVSEPDLGIYDALNKGLLRTAGDVVGFLHSDDLLADTETLSTIAAAFADPDVDAVYGDLVYVRKDNCDQVIRYWQAGSFSRRKLAWGWMPPHPTLYLRRQVYERFGLFDTGYRIAADYDFMLRVLGSGIRVEYLPKVLVKMRVGGASNRSVANVLQKSREDYLALRKNRIGGIGALIWKNLSKLPQFIKR